MKKEFNLSEKVFSGLSNSAIHTQDVKEFIRELKDILNNPSDFTLADREYMIGELDKLAGEKLKQNG